MMRRLLAGAAALVAVPLLGALALVFSQSPREMPGAGGLDFSAQIGAVSAPPAPLLQVPMRDGTGLPVRTYGGADGVPLLVLVHGSGWHGLQFDALGASLAGVADVVVPDLRGHGEAPVRRGDIDYIGQLEDDLADLITALAKPGQPVIMAGHSSGGGLVVRFAGGPHGEMLDGAVLLAPYLGHDAPTTREASGGWAHALTRRIIGLSLLNRVGITALNHLPVVQFDMPRAVLDGPLGETATLAYSYRLNTSFAPRRDLAADLAGLPRFVLLAGGADEAFVAQQYAPTMAPATDKGRYELMTFATHLGLVDDPRTLAIITGFLDEF